MQLNLNEYIYKDNYLYNYNFGFRVRTDTIAFLAFSNNTRLLILFTDASSTLIIV